VEQEKSYVRTYEHGVMRVAATQIMLDSVLAGFHQGHSPETIQQQYPALSLEEVYGAITYYLANQTEIDDYLQRQKQIWQRERERANRQPSPVLQRLRGLKQQGVSSE
jgi:uncharacterized protein (DUF433 family)